MSTPNTTPMTTATTKPLKSNKHNTGTVRGYAYILKQHVKIHVYLIILYVQYAVFSNRTQAQVSLGLMRLHLNHPTSYDSRLTVSISCYCQQRN